MTPEFKPPTESSKCRIFATQYYASINNNGGPISDTRLRVVSHFGDGDCGAGEIHTRTRAKFGGDATRRERRKLVARARVCSSRVPQSPSPSPKLETTRSLIRYKMEMSENA